jgi:hypothetical protein
MAGGVAVSVVVPVHNPGPAIENCLGSLVTQSLSAGDYEVIFVDDGSTDETPARLDALAAEHPNIHVFHEAASGWSGRPRNVGIDHAVGEYVFFCDHDDWLGPEALERMVAYAGETACDVLIPKMVGHDREVPRQLFVANQPDATLTDSLLMSSLTPHKLFRRSFLNRHGLRFPEGRRRLEDHVFVVAAYFLAAKIAVLSDYPCYHHIRRDDGANAAYDPTDPVEYLRYVGEVIDVIEAHTEPGPLRDLVLERPFGSELLGRVTRPRLFGSQPPEGQQHAFDAVRAMMLDRFPSSFDQRMPLVPRVRAAAVRDDSIDTLRELTRQVATLRGRAVLRSMTWRGDRWQAAIEAGARFEDGSSVELTPAGEGRWRADERLAPRDLADRFLLTTRQLTGSAVLVTVTNRTTDEEWYAPARFAAELREIDGDHAPARELIFTGTVDVDVMTLAGGRPLVDGLWDISLRFAFLGVGVHPRVGVDAATVRPLPTAAIIGPRPATVTPFLTDGHDKLTIDVGQRKRTVLDAILAGPIGPALVTEADLRIPVAVDVAPGAAPRSLRLSVLDGDATVGQCDAVLESAPSGGVLVVSPRVVVLGAMIGAGSYDLAARARAKDEPRLLGRATLDNAARITAVELGG